MTQHNQLGYRTNTVILGDADVPLLTNKGLIHWCPDCLEYHPVGYGDDAVIAEENWKKIGEELANG